MKKRLKVKNKYVMPDSGPLERELEDSLRRVRLPFRNKPSYAQRMRRRKIIGRFLFFAALLLLFILAYIFMNILLDLSNMQV